MKYFATLLLIFISCQDDIASSGNNNEEDGDDNAGSNYYTLNLNSTGASHLVVFLDTITGLDPGDEIGVFDANGVVVTDSSGTNQEYGEVLVGALIWDGEANPQGNVADVATIMSEDLSSFGGPILNGAVDGNDVIIKIYDVSEGLERNTTPVFGGGGQFGDIFTTVESIIIGP